MDLKSTENRTFFKFDELKRFFDKKNSLLLKFFIVIFLVNIIILNWSDVSWIFNYTFWSRKLNIADENDKLSERPDSLNDLINELEKQSFAKDSAFSEAGEAVEERASKIEIPKIEITAPIIFPETNEENELEAALKNGVIHFPSSALPGDIGSVIILGHSASPNWPKINYDWVFGRLNELETGDMVFVFHDGKKYSYKISNKFFLEKGQDIPQNALTKTESLLYLVTCWPPGRNLKRIIIEAEIIKTKT